MKYSLQSFLITFVCSLVVFAIAAVLLWNTFGKELVPEIGAKENPTEQTPASENPIEDDTIPGTIDPELEIKGESFTLLLNGIDDDKNVIDASLIIKVDKERRRVVIATVDTDTRVYIGHTETSDEHVVLGELLKFKNSLYLLDKVYSITGLKADYYINVNMSDFARVIDTLYPGGYRYVLPISMEYTDEVQGLEIKFAKGDVVSSGEDILKVLRYKSDSEDKRMSRQRDFIASFIKKAVPDKISLSDTARTVSIFKSVAAIVDTNISSDFILSNIELISLADEFEFVFVPRGGTSQYIKYR